MSTLRKAMQDILSDKAPGAVLQAVIPVCSARLETVYELQLSGGYTMQLLLPPPPHLNLLCFQQDMIMSEVAVLQWLRTTDPQIASDVLSGTTCSFDAPDRGSPSSPKTCKPSTNAGQVGSTSIIDWLHLAPSPVAHGHLAGPPFEKMVAYSIVQYAPGSLLSAVRPALTTTERKAVAYQTGKIVYRISRLISPSRKFGPATSVFQISHSRLGPVHGEDSWASGFTKMLIDIISEAKSRLITLPYGIMKQHLDRFKGSLDMVTDPRLVVIDAFDETSLCVMRRNDRNSIIVPPEKCSTEDTRRSAKSVAVDGDISATRPTTPQHGLRDYGDEAQHVRDSDIVITGLRNWRHCILGDVLFAKQFCNQKVDADFLRGFDDAESLTTDHGDTARLTGEAQTRMLLYRCYHATVEIVEEFCQPERQNSDRELEARERLMAALRGLEAAATSHVTTNHSKVRKLSHLQRGEDVSPAKRAKLSESSLIRR